MDTGDGKRCLVLLDCKTNKPRTTECHWITLTTRIRAPFLHCNSILIEGGIVRRVVLVLGLKKRQRAYIQKAKGRIVRDSSICNCCVKTTYVCTCRDCVQIRRLAARKKVGILERRRQLWAPAYCAVQFLHASNLKLSNMVQIRRIASIDCVD
jgi:hypothetical protein